jgi:hypothetical protein
MASMIYNDSNEDGEDQKFWCTFEGCGKCYKQKRNLMIHVKLDHVDQSLVQWHECNAEGCAKTFKYKCALNRHIVLYHSGPEAREAMLARRRKNHEVRSVIPNEEKKWRVLVGAVEADPESKLFQCCNEGCTRVFTSKGSLNLHIERKHERPGAFVCPVETCARQFSYKHVLQTHVERIHHIPFNHEDFPNPKRQRTPRNKPQNPESPEPEKTMLVVADDSDPDSEDEDEDDDAKLIVQVEPARAKRSAAPASASSRAMRSALGNLADMAARSATLVSGAGSDGAEGADAAAAAATGADSAATLPGVPKSLPLYECDHPGCSKVCS